MKSAASTRDDDRPLALRFPNHIILKCARCKVPILVIKDDETSAQGIREWVAYCQPCGKILEAPPAAERTALKELKAKIGRLPRLEADLSGTRGDPWPILSPDPAGRYIERQDVLRFIQDEIDAASASEGTNTP